MGWKLKTEICHWDWPGFLIQYRRNTFTNTTRMFYNNVRVMFTLLVVAILVGTGIVHRTDCSFTTYSSVSQKQFSRGQIQSSCSIIKPVPSKNVGATTPNTTTARLYLLQHNLLTWNYRYARGHHLWGLDWQHLRATRTSAFTLFIFAGFEMSGFSASRYICAVVHQV